MAVALLTAPHSLAQGSNNWLADYQPSWQKQTQAHDGYPSVAMAADSAPAASTPTEALLPAPSSYSEPWAPAVAPSESYGDSQFVYGGVPGECEPHRICYAEAEILALRAHFGETALGKVAEKYEASQRVVIGVENTWGTGGRVRYWSYDRTTPIFSGASNSIRFDFDVIDFEGTTRFATDRFDLVIAGGVRWADIKIDIDTGRSRNDMPGGTVAADLRTLICRDCDYGLEWHSISGARMSIFGGDWEGGAGGLITPSRDDNLTVLEIYGGVECSREFYGSTIYTRLLFESQNWRSDALGRDTGQDSLSFIGPALSLGVLY
jgi:hypothetical protein